MLPNYGYIFLFLKFIHNGKGMPMERVHHSMLRKFMASGLIMVLSVLLFGCGGGRGGGDTATTERTVASYASTYSGTWSIILISTGAVQDVGTWTSTINDAGVVSLTTTGGSGSNGDTWVGTVDKTGVLNISSSRGSTAAGTITTSGVVNASATGVTTKFMMSGAKNGSVPSSGILPAGTQRRMGTLIGVFGVAPADGVYYKTMPGDVTGLTENGGQFRYFPGDRVTFYLGGDDSKGILVADAVLAQSRISPLEVFDTRNTGDRRVVNLSRILLSLDDHSIPGRLVISEAMRAAVDVERSVTLDLSRLDFDYDPELGNSQNHAKFVNSVTARLGVARDLVDAAVAQKILEEAVLQQVQGAIGK